MKMKLVICTTDENYASRFVDYFNVHYGDKIELSQFTDVTLLKEYVLSKNVDICLLGIEMIQEGIDIEMGKSVPVILAEDREEDLDTKIIFKYQKAEFIYKELLNVLADRKSGVKMFRRKNPGQARSYVFCSPSGGAGATTTAIAYAMNLAKNKKVLYLNLQQFANSGTVLKGEGNGKFDDVIFALKSKRSNLEMKLESLVRTSKEKVCFYENCENPLDMQELSVDEIKMLLEELLSGGVYQEVVIDIDNCLRPLEIAVMEQVDHIVCVEGGYEENQMKFMKYYRCLEMIEKRNEKELADKVVLFYNKFSNKTSRDISGGLVTVIGGIPRFEGVQMAGIAGRAAVMDVFEELKKAGE